MMKLFRFLLALCVSLGISVSAAYAHWFPESEMYIGGVGYGCTMEYVKGIFGEPKEKKWFNLEGYRGVRYIYSNAFSVTARVRDNDPAPEGKLTVTNVNLKASNLSTPNGITVGIPFQTVAGMYGMGEKKKFSNRTFYYYPLAKTKRSMTFYVNDHGIITEIIYAEEW